MLVLGGCEFHLYRMNISLFINYELNIVGPMWLNYLLGNLICVLNRDINFSSVLSTLLLINR